MSIKINFPAPTGSNAVYGPKRRIHSKEVPNFEKCTVYIQEMMKNQYDSKTHYLRLEYKVDDEWCVIDSNETYQCALAEFDKVLEMDVLLKELDLVATTSKFVLKPPVVNSSSIDINNNGVNKDNQNDMTTAQESGTLTATVAATAAITAIHQPVVSAKATAIQAIGGVMKCEVPIDNASNSASTGIMGCTGPEGPPGVRENKPKFQIGEHVYSKFILYTSLSNAETMSQKYYPAIVEAYDAKSRSYTVFFPNDLDRYSNVDEPCLRSTKEVKFGIADLVEWTGSENHKSTLWQIVWFDAKTGKYGLVDPRYAYRPSESVLKIANSYAELKLVQSEQRYSNSMQVYLHPPARAPFIILHYNGQERTYSLINPAEAAQWSEGQVQVQTVSVDKIFGERLPPLTEGNFKAAAAKIFERFCSPFVSKKTVWNVQNWIDFYYSNVTKTCDGTNHYQVIAEQFYHRSTNRYAASDSDKLSIPQTETGQLLLLKSFIEFCVKGSRSLAWQWLFAQGFNTQFAHKEYQFVVGEIVYARNHSGTKVNANAVQCKVVQVDPDEDKLELQPLEESVQLTYMYPVFSVCKKLVCPNVQGCQHCVDERNATKLAANVVCICNGKRFVTID
jgi:hypothetical protein